MNEKKILIGIAAGTLLISAGLGYGVYYTLGAIDEQENSIATTREDIKKARTTLDGTRKLEDKVIILRESVAALASVLPTQSGFADFITQIAATKGESGVTLRELTVKNANAKIGQGKVFEKFGYTIGLKGNLWQFLEFVYRVESFKLFVMIPRLKVSPGTRDKGISDVTHGFDLDVETFVYNPGRATTPEPIPSYDKRKESLREEIEQAKFIIEQQPVEFAGQRGRRDIFVDPRVKDGLVEGGKTPEEQSEIITKLRLRIEEVQGLMARVKESTSFIERFELRKQLEERVPGIESEIDKITKEGSITAPLILRSFQNEIKDQFGKIKLAFEKQPGDAGPNPRELADIVTKTRGFLNSGRLRECIDSAKPVLEKWASLDKDPARKGYIEELRKIDRDAKIAERFEQKKLVIGGVILYEDRKAALVNGKTVEPGDSLDDDLTIADIQEDGVTFVLDNVQITKKW